MDDLIRIGVILLFSIFGVGGLILILLFLNIEKVEKWLALFGFFLNKLGGFFKSAHKQAVKLDLQGSINDYVKQIVKKIPSLNAEKVSVVYVDNNINRSGFLKDGKVILRLRRDDPEDLNFVHGAFLYVSTSLLYKVKRYISTSQRDALDLYVTTRLIEKEKPHQRDFFLGEYLHPKLSDETSDRKMYFDKLALIDEGGLFYPVLIEELNCLGSKVFGKRQDDVIISEVRELIDFLEVFSQRVIGVDEQDLEFHRNYCKSSIVIIGKALKIINEDKIPYINFIRNTLYPKKTDTIYILGNVRNKEIIDAVCYDVSDIYNTVHSQISKRLLHYQSGSSKLVDTLIVLLQRKDASLYISQ